MFPVNRVPDILRRMDMNTTQAEAMKTCFGILAIMSREDSNKALIAKDGMETILNVMTAHIDRTDVQEAGCDLLWSLAFNSGVVKEIIAKCTGSTVLVRALKRHSRSADFLKSACGALSNICQFRANQEGVASQGGLQPLVGSIHIHQSNGKLLPFIFDAIASIIVNNEDNARGVSSLGIIPVVVASLSRHKTSAEVVKSGCHTLAILSDVKGQASKIAFAGGVPVILSLLDQHPLYADLHRVAAVVLLRMLQESSHVGKEISCHEGVRILLHSLEKGGAQQDTVAAVTHILYTITNPNSPSFSSIEPQLWTSQNQSNPAEQSGIIIPVSGQTIGQVKPPVGALYTQTALGGVVSTLEQYCSRRDVVRAACRLLTNLTSYPNVALALDRLCILDKICECIALHRETKDIMEAAIVLMRTINKKKGSVAFFSGRSGGSIAGLVHLIRAKVHDEEAVSMCLELLCGLTSQASDDMLTEGADLEGALHSSTDSKIDGRQLDVQLLSVCNLVLENAGFAGGRDEASVNSSVTMEIRGSNKYSSGSAMPISSARVAMFNKILGCCEQIVLHGRLSTDEAMLVSTVEHFDRLGKYLSGTVLTNGHGLGNVAISEFCSRVQNFADRIEEKRQQHQPLVDASAPTASGDDISVISKNVNVRSNHHNGSTYKVVASTNAFNRRTEPVVASNLAEGSYPISHLSNDNLKQQNSKSMANGALARKYLPEHPLKCGDQSTGLISSWPSYLERLLPPSNAAFLRPNCLPNIDGVNVPSRMHVCYESNRAGGKNLLSRCIAPFPYAVPVGGTGYPFDHSLTFDSEFESGNLHRVVQVGDAAYDLVLRADMHTQGHTQWFYFAVSNTHPMELVRLAEQGVVVPAVRVRFHIVNFTKPDSLFNLGMRPVFYSVKDATERGIGWVRAGSDISYYINSYTRNNNAGEGVGNYYSLSFTAEFHNPKDTVLIAYSYPYTMTDYKLHVADIVDRGHSDHVLRKLKLCTTLGGEDCEMLVVTDFKDKDRIGPISMANMEYTFGDDLSAAAATAASTKAKSKENRYRTSYKPALFLSGRVHPGETPASWMMKGILDFLVSDSPSALLLRRIFVIFIVPVLNPDGVILGNNRCSLAGVDLNRQWKTPDKGNHPTIYHFKLFMTLQKKIREVAMFIDLHGHSRKYNVFMYGCDDKKKPKPQVRAFPRFFANHNVGGKYVCYEDCSFHVKKGRESTARVVVAKDMLIPYSFTLEATFCGSNYGSLNKCHFNIGHLLEVGAALCDTILKFSVSEGYGKDVALPGGSEVKHLSMLSYEGFVDSNGDQQRVEKQDRESERMTKLEESSLSLAKDGEDLECGLEVEIEAENDGAAENGQDGPDMENDAVEDSDSDSEGSSRIISALNKEKELESFTRSDSSQLPAGKVRTTRVGRADSPNLTIVDQSIGIADKPRGPSGSAGSKLSATVGTRSADGSRSLPTGNDRHTLMAHSIAGDVISNTICGDSGDHHKGTSSVSSNISSGVDVINDGTMEFLFRSKRNGTRTKVNSSRTNRASTSANSGELMEAGFALTGNKLSAKKSVHKSHIEKGEESVLSRSFPSNASCSDSTSVKTAPTSLGHSRLSSNSNKL